MIILRRWKIAEKAGAQLTLCQLLEKLASQGSLSGALITTDAMGGNPRVTQSILEHQADYLIALKGNQSDLLDDVKTFFKEPSPPVEKHIDHDKGHGRIETRPAHVCPDVAWLKREKFPDIAMIACVENQTETKKGKGKIKTQERRFYIS